MFLDLFSCAVDYFRQILDELFVTAEVFFGEGKRLSVYLQCLFILTKLIFTRFRC